ncbi:hypothetical protein Bphy_4703 [Paraburkholderia phymatum STM815]|uniref:Uncharacterized protein n=1 Tax=Paraburkholderia phymatum (strain DSM 17167 / CIP 108236 / LMG 21445 / STM815) TaxID=391038 RepID=B2JRE6_PARP8|nr:hypothetical protein Bphy_4703 [Paraburkholderia phymatum STM815]
MTLRVEGRKRAILSCRRAGEYEACPKKRAALSERNEKRAKTWLRARRSVRIAGAGGKSRKRAPLIASRGIHFFGYSAILAASVAVAAALLVMRLCDGAPGAIAAYGSPLRRGAWTCAGVRREI